MINFLAVQNAEIVVIDQFHDWDMIVIRKYKKGNPVSIIVVAPQQMVRYYMKQKL